MTLSADKSLKEIEKKHHFHINILIFFVFLQLRKAFWV